MILRLLSVPTPGRYLNRWDMTRIKSAYLYYRYNNMLKHAKEFHSFKLKHSHDTDPAMFHLEHINRAVDLRFYSRLREINEESNFSVLG